MIRVSKIDECTFHVKSDGGHVGVLSNAGMAVLFAKRLQQVCCKGEMIYVEDSAHPDYEAEMAKNEV